MLISVLLAAIAVSPQPSPSPLRTITEVHVRAVCTVVREELEPAMNGMLADDRLTDRGQQLLNRLGTDAQNDYIGDMGGAGGRVSMDNLRVETIANGMASNIEKIQKLLDKAKDVPTRSNEQDALAAARLLQEAVAQQKAEVNILSFVAYSNNGRDLQGKLDPTGGNALPPSTYQREAPALTLPEILLERRKATHEAELQAAGALAPLIAECR
ncbi:MAG TPA: hypothetical protein VIO32_08840 [Candidatus Baltobacteraceae bacterium]